MLIARHIRMAARKGSSGLKDSPLQRPTRNSTPADIPKEFRVRLNKTKKRPIRKVRKITPKILKKAVEKYFEETPAREVVRRAEKLRPPRR